MNNHQFYNIFCQPCYVPECNSTIMLPHYLQTYDFNISNTTFSQLYIEPYDMSCDQFTQSLFYNKMNLFKMVDSSCYGPRDNYMCDVFVEPFKEMFEDFCYAEEITNKTIEKMQQQSLCNSFKGCPSVQWCFNDSFSCYNGSALPHIEFNKSQNKNVSKCNEKIIKEPREIIPMPLLVVILVVIITLCLF